MCNTSYHLICGGCTRVLLLQWYVYKLQVFSFVSAFLLPLFLLLLLLLLDCLILLLLFCCCFCSFHYVVGFVTHNGVLLCFLLFLLISFLLVFFLRCVMLLSLCCASAHLWCVYSCTRDVFSCDVIVMVFPINQAPELTGVILGRKWYPKQSICGFWDTKTSSENNSGIYINWSRANWLDVVGSSLFRLLVCSGYGRFQSTNTLRKLLLTITHA